MRYRFSRSARLVTALISVACGGPPSFECENSGACDVRAGGVCEVDGLCSYRDDVCASGKRYGENAGTQSGACVDAPAPEADASIAPVGEDAGGEDPDAGEPSPSDAGPEPVAAPTPRSLQTLPLNSDSTKTTASFAVEAGDVLVAWTIPGNETLRTDITSSPGLTWTVRQDVVEVDFPRLRLATATVATAGAMTVTFTESSPSGENHSEGVLCLGGTAGIGASAKRTASGAPSIDLGTTGEHSTVVVVTGDYRALDGGGRVWRTGAGPFSELDYDRLAGQVTTYAGRYGDVGAAGTRTFGLTAPGNQQYAIAAIEILGR